MAKINNVTCTAFLGFPINLDECFSFFTCYKCFSQIKYNPSKFGALMLKFTNDKITLLVWSSGNIVVTGGKHPNDNFMITKRLVETLHRLYGNINYSVARFVIQNIQATGSTGFGVKFDSLSSVKNMFYQPEIFPGLEYTPFEDKNTKVLIFTTGKFVLTGVKKLKMIETLYTDILNLLVNHKTR